MTGRTAVPAKRVRSIALAQVFVLAGCLAAAPVGAQVAPPRTSDDLIKLLEHYKPDASKAQSSRAEADRQPPDTQNAGELAVFYFDRGRAAARIGRISQQIEDLRRAVEYANKGAPQINLSRLYSDLASAETRGGNLLNAMKLREMQSAAGGRNAGPVITAQSQLAALNAALGDLPAARAALKTATDAYAIPHAAGFARDGRLLQHAWAARIERARAVLASAEGRGLEAEEGYRKSLAAHDADTPFRAKRAQRSGNDELNVLERETVQRNHAASLMNLNRPVEAEAAVRDVLKRTLQRVGRYSVDAGASVALLSAILLQQGRHDEAETFAREALDILIKIGVTPESQFMVASYDRLGTVVAMRGRWAEADAAFKSMREGLAKDPLLLEKRGPGRVAWAFAMVKLGRPEPALTMLTAMLQRNRDRHGDGSYEVAEIQGFLAIARVAAGQSQAALADCMASAPVLIRENTNVGERGTQRQWALTQILEGCIGLFVDSLKGGQNTPDIDALAESFRLADAARGGRVQRALASSAARAAIADPQLAELARTEQDAGQRLAALNDLLSNALSAPPGQQVPRIIEDLRRETEQVRAERDRTKAQIEKRFPDYADLVSPRPPTVEQIKATLRESEALISTYVAADRTFVWAVPAKGNAAVASVALGDPELTARVAHLRKALDANATTIDDIPAFDVAAAHALYAALLKPVESAWGGATSVLVVPHLALAQLPFALLPTDAATLAEKETLTFQTYRQVPWLARRVAITQLPSVNALITLRRAVPADTSRRAYVGFGDPFFSRKHAAEGVIALADDALGTRGLRLRNTPKTAKLDSAQLAALPPLPDTRAEILDVAMVMKADLKQDVFLGERASVHAVMTTSLANRKVIHFATHGLVAGELDGLTQPALALSAPELSAPGTGDGLLKLEDILALKLNADWVVLSACNTASADGSGNAEAVSGLGRAFFFAGARALLVSNWPVDSPAARKLMTELFRRQAADATLDRAGALRQAMLHTIDSGVQTDSKDKPLYSYAHPLFWAPFSLVGDGAGR